jgi:hypothetical protein
MKTHTLFTVAILTGLFSVLFSAPRTFAMDCPVKFGTEGFSDQVNKAIEAQKTCQEASSVTEACAMGSRMDAGFVASALKICNKRIDHANSKTQKLMAATVQLCVKKYAKSEGTIAISSRAFCSLSVARLFDELLETPEVYY